MPFFFFFFPWEEKNPAIFNIQPFNWMKDLNIENFKNINIWRKFGSCSDLNPSSLQYFFVLEKKITFPKYWVGYTKGQISDNINEKICLELMKLLLIFLLRFYGPLMLLRGICEFIILALHPLLPDSPEGYISSFHTDRSGHSSTPNAHL